MKTKAIALGVGVVIGGGAVLLATSHRAQFMTAGGLINAGYAFQDHIDSFDLEHEHDITPAQVWEQMLQQNELASGIRKRFPRTARHPIIAMLVCMDARLDTTELAGDTRKNYYIVRTAGSILEEPEQEMLELAVRNGVKVLVLTRHTDCAAEKAAADPASRAAFPALTAAVERRSAKVKEFLARPYIAQRVAKGELLVKELLIDTADDHLVPDDGTAHTAAVPSEHNDAHH